MGILNSQFQDVYAQAKDTLNTYLNFAMSWCDDNVVNFQ